MAPSSSATIDIAAPPKAVWAVLTDYDRYPEWNPFITNMSGDKEGLSCKNLDESMSIEGFRTVGGKLTVTIKPPKDGLGEDSPSMIATFSPSYKLHHWRKEDLINSD